MLGSIAPIFVKLPPQDIVFVKFALESYDGLGIVRTLDPHRGEIVILAQTDTVGEVESLLEDLKNTVDLRVIPPPSSAAKDWLLAPGY